MSHNEKNLLCVICFILVGAFILGCALYTPRAKQYPVCAVVCEIDQQNNIVTVEDFNGNLWQFEGCEDWREGDICAMIMNDNSTEEIYDDTIEMVAYNGWIE